MRVAQAAAAPVNQDEQELALALSGAHILRLLKDAPERQARILDMRRMICRPARELILAIGRMVQLGLVDYGEGDQVRLSELGAEVVGTRRNGFLHRRRYNGGLFMLCF